MARKKRRPASGGGSSSTGLVIALVFSLLVNIGLGIGTWLGFSGQQAFDDKRVDAEKKYEAEKKHAKAMEYETVLYRLTTGTAKYVKKDPKSEEEQTDLDLLQTLDKGYKNAKPEFPDEKDKKTKDRIDQTIADLAKLGVKDYAKDNLVLQLAALKEVNGTLAKSLETQRDEAKKAREQFEADRKDLGTQLANQKKLVQTAQEQIAAAKAEKPVQVEALEDKWKKAIEDNGVLKTEIAKLKQSLGERDELIATLQKNVKDEIAKRKKVEQADKVVKLNMLDYQKPWGRIVRLDPTGTMAWIDLGSAQNVKPQLTFSIATRSLDAKNKYERKGSLEVVRVVDRRMSLARITAVNDAFNDPIVSGDELYNPTWSPTQKEHVAITGFIDLTGDGTDNTAEFVRNLERQGVNVDAFLDMKTVKVVPHDLEGITPQTRYLIVGDNPSFETGVPLNRDDPRNTQKEKIIVEMSKMQNRARDLGLTVVQYRDYLVMIGYAAPRAVLDKRPVRSMQAKGGEPKLEAKEKDDKPADEKPKDDKPKDDKPKLDKPKDDKPKDDKPKDKGDDK